MKSIVSLGAVLALAGAAVAGPFSIGTVDASNGLVAGGLPGTGLDFNGGVVYQDGFGTPGNTGEPNAAFIPLAPSLEFDTYLTVDSGPVSATLAPGWYAAVFGTGAFGATLGSATVHSNSGSGGCASGFGFPFSIRQSDGMLILQGATPHFVVEGLR